MKVLLFVGFIVVATGFVVYAFSASMAPGDFEDHDAGITGPLARGAVSRANDPIRVWKRPRSTATRKEREEMLVGTLEDGDEFEVLNHFSYGGQLWVHVVDRSNPALTGWIHSPAADPIKASKLN